MGVNKYFKSIFFQWLKFWLFNFWSQEKIKFISFITNYCYSKWNNHFFKSEGLTLMTPQRTASPEIFSSEDMLCEKTSAIRNCKNCNHNFEFKILRVVGSWQGCDTIEIAQHWLFLRSLSQCGVYSRLAYFHTKMTN